uniref:Uncharacterized protein n=1 Tax=Romanomermis culicivorax TaxID=13658 RepID=A0A915KY92_ROMCU
MTIRICTLKRHLKRLNLKGHSHGINVRDVAQAI